MDIEGLPPRDAILKTLRWLNRRRGPAPAVLVGDLAGVPERTARHWLRQFESAGIVSRPSGPKSGWVVAV